MFSPQEQRQRQSGLGVRPLESEETSSIVPGTYRMLHRPRFRRKADPGTLQRNIDLDPRQGSCEAVRKASSEPRQRSRQLSGSAGLTVTVNASGDTFMIYDQDRLLTEVPRRATKPIARFKARKPEAPRARTNKPTVML